MSLAHRSSIPFRWILPIVELAICAVILWPARGTLIQQSRNSANAYERPTPQVSLDRQYFEIIAIPLSPQEQRQYQLSGRREQWAFLLNFPVLLAQLPYAILSPPKDEWVPEGMDFEVWRAISWPLIGVAFWWSAGCGIEALLAAKRRLVYPRISWVETGVGAFIFVVCAVGLSTALFKGFDKGIIAGALWAVLGLATVAARVVQWRLRKCSTSTLYLTSPRLNEAHQP